MPLKVYLKLRNGKWMLISRKLEHAVTIGKRRVVRYILAGEPVDNPPSVGSVRTVLVPATIVSRLVSRLLDRGHQSVVFMEQHDREHFLVRADAETVRLVEELLHELTAGKKSSAAKTGAE